MKRLLSPGLLTLLSSATLLAQNFPAATLPPEVQAQVQKLSSDSLAHQIQAAWTIGEMGAKAAPAIPILFERLKGYDGMVDVDTVLFKYFPPNTAFLFYQGKAATINPVHIVLTNALAKIGNPVIPRAAADLRAADPTELYFAYLSDLLAMISDSEANAIVIDLLKDANPHVRFRAAESLKYAASLLSLDALINALQDPEQSVRDAALVSLERRTKQNFGTDAKKWREWRAQQSLHGSAA